MRKFLAFTLIMCWLVNLAAAQAYEGTAQFDKKKQPAIIIDYAYPPEAVENAIIQKMEKLGYKPKEEKGIFNKDKGYLVFKNAYVTDISAERMDYIVKVERKSRRDDDEAVLYVIMIKDDINALDKLDAFDVGRAKSFLNNLLPEIEAANLELQIRDQEEVVVKAEKKLANLRKEKDELEKKLADNIRDQESTSKDIESQKQALENLKGKRKS